MHFHVCLVDSACEAVALEGDADADLQASAAGMGGGLSANQARVEPSTKALQEGRWANSKVESPARSRGCISHRRWAAIASETGVMATSAALAVPDQGFSSTAVAETGVTVPSVMVKYST